MALQKRMLWNTMLYKLYLPKIISEPPAKRNFSTTMYTIVSYHIKMGKQENVNLNSDRYEETFRRIHNKAAKRCLTRMVN
jgi:hypothetical protein